MNPTLSFASASTNAIALSALAQYSSPATISSFSPPSGGGTASVAGDGQSVTYVAPTVAKPAQCEPANTVTYDVPYLVRTTSNGASASGIAHVNVTGPPGYSKPGLCDN